MSLAPASSLGAFLKARFAVNGIQCAARSFGTATAEGRGLLSNMGPLQVLGRGGCTHAISFVAIRKRQCAAIFRRIRDRSLLVASLIDIDQRRQSRTPRRRILRCP